MQTRSHERGFTLIELLTVIAIIFIMVAIVLAGTRNWRDVTVLEEASIEVLSVVREARSYAMAVREHDGAYPSYGVYFERGSGDIITYADCEADDNAPIGAITADDIFDYNNTNNCSGGTDVITTTLEGVEVQQITLNEIGGSTDTASNLSVLFMRPEPTIWFSTGSTLQYLGEVEIELEHLNTGQTRTVYINSSGLVEAQ
jgi:prepilin-type N-terminal cleavage/methylation domain-containing protein